MARNNDNEKYICSKYEKLNKMTLEEQINYFKTNNVVVKSDTKEVINELNKVYIKSNNTKPINSSEIEYIKKNFVKLSVEGLMNKDNNRNDKSNNNVNKEK